MLISDAETAHVALILVRNEFRAGADFDELFGQEQAAVDRAGVYDAHVRVAQPARPPLAFRRVQPHVNAARETFGHAVRKDYRRVEEDVRVIDVAEVTSPERGVQPNPSSKILSESGFVGRDFFRMYVRAAAVGACERGQTARQVR